MTTKIQSTSNTIKVINYNGKRYEYDNCIMSFLDSFDSDELWRFSFTRKGKHVLKYDDFI